jgi:hypothetical protein
VKQNLSLKIQMQQEKQKTEELNLKLLINYLNTKKIKL